MTEQHPCAYCPYEDLCESGKLKESECSTLAKYRVKILHKTLNKLSADYRRTLKSRDYWKQKYSELKRLTK